MKQFSSEYAKKCFAQADDLSCRSGGSGPLPVRGAVASPWKPDTNRAPYMPFTTGSSPGVSEAQTNGEMRGMGTGEMKGTDNGEMRGTDNGENRQW